MFKDIFPPIETALDMEPEELGAFVLKHLSLIQNINRYNYTLGTQPEIREYAGKHIKDFQERLMEAWVWLEREMLIARKPGQDGDWAFITRRGNAVLENQDFAAYAKESLLVSETLDPILVRKVKPLFLRGDYETAIFQAFKEVEVRVRQQGGCTNQDLGVTLMRKAFDPKTGTLTDPQAEHAEKEAMAHLFAGAIGLYKNPASHRNVKSVSPEEAADIIRFANLLLRMVTV